MKNKSLALVSTDKVKLVAAKPKFVTEEEEKESDGEVDEDEREL